jgi:DNA-binding response OmpR family regulator
MNRLFIIAQPELTRRFEKELGAAGFTCYSAAPGDDIARIAADIVLISLDGDMPYSKMEEMCRTLKLERRLPLIALVSKDTLAARTAELKVLPCDDFLIEPYERQEMLLRVRKLTGEEQSSSDEKLVCGDLVINTTQAEVFLSGRLLELTFREYELLRFLASNPGRLYSRDALLNHVWGYDYFGGDRTVDVHVRRLRSKIEDQGHSFIDTVRNMGYRFRKQE